MMYQLYQAAEDVMAPVRSTARLLEALVKPFTASPWAIGPRHLAATYHMIGRSGFRHERPDYRINEVVSNGKTIEVREETILETPFAKLIRFNKQSKNKGAPVIVVAAMSGHFATLTRDTVRTLLQDHDVYITDWKSARDMPVSAGRFGLDEYIDHVIQFLEFLGPVNVVAICQSCPPVIAALSIMAQRGSENQPDTVTLMAGPVDPRISPNKINKLAENIHVDTFRMMLSKVPSRYAGAGRSVYPGFMQLSGFVTMNIDNHINKHIDLYNALVQKNETAVKKTEEFYDEYITVMDATEEFLLETIQRIFIDYDLPKGQFYHHGVLVTPEAITTPILVIEGENDDLCGRGQTSAAFDLIPDAYHQYYLQPGVGHYGVFSGSKWQTGIYPVVRNFIAA